MFILVANVIGIIPYTFTVTSHILHYRRAGAAGLLHGHRLRLLQRGLRFLRLFVPHGIPIYVLPLS